MKRNLFLLIFVLLDDGEGNTITLGESDNGLISLTDDKDVLDSGRESVSARVLKSDDVMRTIDLGDVSHDSDSSSVVSLRDVGNISEFEGKNVSDLFLFEIELDGIVHFDGGVGEANSASVSGDEVGDLVGAHLLALNSAKDEVGFSLLDFNKREASLHVVEAAPGRAHFGHIDDVHKTDGVLEIATDVLVDLDESLLLVKNNLRFVSIESNFDFVTEEELDGDALSQLVGSGGGTHGEVSAHFVHQPAFRCSHAFQMFFRSSSLMKLPCCFCLLYKFAL